jgi:ATP-dependent Clp protease ATP-binding subunit ClpA
VLEKHHERADPRRRARNGGEACRTATFPARQLPDKAVSLLDTACARVAHFPAFALPGRGRGPACGAGEALEASSQGIIAQREAAIGVEVDEAQGARRGHRAGRRSDAATGCEPSERSDKQKAAVAEEARAASPAHARRCAVALDRRCRRWVQASEEVSRGTGRCQ